MVFSFCHCEERSDVAISWKRNAARVPAPAKCPRWLTAEKSPAGETETTVRGYTQTLARGGTPPH